MDGVRGFFRGALSVPRGLLIISRAPDLRRLALLPILITAVLWLVTVTATAANAQRLLGLVWARPDGGAALVFWYALLPVLFVLAVVGLALLAVTCAGLVAGPFYDRMAASVLRKRGLRVHDSSFVDGALWELARAMVFVIPAVTCAAIGLIPGVGVPFVGLAAGLSWLGLGSTALSPTLLAAGLPFGARLRALVAAAPILAGAGAVIALSLLVPLLGLLSLPCAVVGAAELWADAARGASEGRQTLTVQD